jgi:hypothetical protein
MKLTDDNFLVYAMHHYDNPQCHSIEEFEEDLKRFLYLKKLFYRYKKDGELRERLILNHIIVLYNLFGDALTSMLFFKLEKEHWSELATFLVYLNRMPDVIEERGIQLSDITMDPIVVAALRKI